jgi:hypothetical protein
MDERTTRLKTKAITEAKRFAAIVVYLCLLFVLLQLNRLTILREQYLASGFHYQYGFALINALILGKIILIGENLHAGERFKGKPLVYAILFRSAVFSFLLLCFNFLEEVIIGVFHGKTIAQSIPTLGGGGVEGVLLDVLMMFIILLPFFSFRELARVLGQDELLSMVFKGRTA